MQYDCIFLFVYQKLVSCFLDKKQWLCKFAILEFKESKHSIATIFEFKTPELGYLKFQNTFTPKFLQEFYFVEFRLDCKVLFYKK